MSSEKQISRLYRKDFLNVLISKPQSQQLTTNPLNPFNPISMLKLKKERWLFALKYVGFQTSKIWLWIMRTSYCLRLSVQLAAVFHYKRGLLITDCAVLVSMHPVSQLSQVTALALGIMPFSCNSSCRIYFCLPQLKRTSRNSAEKDLCGWKGYLWFISFWGLSFLQFFEGF